MNGPIWVQRKYGNLWFWQVSWFANLPKLGTFALSTLIQVNKNKIHILLKQIQHLPERDEFKKKFIRCFL
jgi:hypothetical protein